jgi:transposase InsO family protein
MAITPRLENVMLEEPEEDCDLFMARTSTVEAGEPPTTSVHVPEPTARALQSATSSTDWIVDSGASRHMTNSLELMVISKPCHVMVYLGEGSIAATRFGVIKLHLDCGPIMFSGVLYVPGLAANLLSTQMLRSKKVFYTTETQVLYKRLDDGSAKVIANIIERKGLPHLTMGTAVQQTTESLMALVSSKSNMAALASVDIWHGRCGHINSRTLTVMATNGLITITGMQRHPRDCISCRESMIKRIHSRIPMVRPTTPYTIVAVDVVTVRTIAWNGSKYFTLATDLCALRRHVYDSPRKNGAALHLKELIAFVFTQYGKQVAVLRIDGGGEYGGNELLALACEKGIKLQVTAPHSSVQNGAAEVSNHIVCTMGRKLIRHAGFPLQAWAEVLHAAVHILNLIPSQALDYRSPNEILDEWLERPPKNKSPLAHLRDYGC